MNLYSYIRTLNRRPLLDNKNGYKFFPILSPCGSLPSSSYNKHVHCRAKINLYPRNMQPHIDMWCPFIWVGMASIYYWERRDACKIKWICMNKSQCLYDINRKKLCLKMYLAVYKHLCLFYIKHLCWGLRRVLLLVFYFLRKY